MSQNSALATIQPYTLMPAGADKHVRYRLRKFEAWQRDQGQAWHNPDLAAYRDHLLASYAPATVSAHLSTVRAQYRRLLRDNVTRDMLYVLAAEQTDDPAERKAFVDELVTRLQNAIDPANSQVKTVTHQDRADADRLRLTQEQAESLLEAPGVDTLAGLRDTAVIAVMLCTGIREQELSSLDLPDLRQELGGELALHVRQGKGAKARLIPYGELDWCLAIVDRWLVAAGIREGPVFRGLYKGGRRLRPGRLSVRAIEYILAAYPVAIRGELAAVKPHDLRRTYARRLYDSGVDQLAIQQNLGHAQAETTQGYIGALDVDQRRAPAIYTYDLRRLNGAPW